MYSNSTSGQKRSSKDSDLDFVSYWADQTVEEAVLRGTQLRQEKLNPLPPRHYDVVQIDYIKPPRSVSRSHRRKKSPKKRVKPQSQRSTSPGCRECQENSSSFSPSNANRYKKCRKTKKKVLCGMRIAELAVPTKRQCLDTWRNKCDTLPANMIERLRQHVLDQRPVVQISDAIYCFKSRCINETKKKKAGDKKSRNIKKTKKSMCANEIKTLGAIFGYNIIKKLNTPLNIILNSDLEKVANVISNDIADLVCQSKKVDMNNTLNKAIHREITKKVTIWISDVLEESTYKYLEDQLKDFEEEAGPVLDVVDDLFDNVLDICIPQPEICAKSSSSYFEAASLEEDVLVAQTSYEQADLEVVSVLEDDKIAVYQNIEDNKIAVNQNIEDDFKNEIITIINNIDKEDTKSDKYLDVGDGPEDVEVQDIDEKSDENLEFDNVSDEHLADEKMDVNVDFDVIEEQRTQDDNKNFTDEKRDENIDSAEPFVSASNEGIDKISDTKSDEFLESEDGGNVEQTSLTSETKNNDDYLDQTIGIPVETDNPTVEGTETFADAIDESKDEDNLPDQQINIEATEPSEGSSDENNKKVTFDDIVDKEGNAEPISDEVHVLVTKSSLDHIDFAPPNEDLLSDADESWPEEIQPPFIRPSQSVSKSVTSLGKITENEEKISVLPDDKVSDLGQESQHGEEDIIVQTEKKDSEEVEEKDLNEVQIDTNSEKIDIAKNKLENEVTKIHMPAKAKDDITKQPKEKKPIKPSKASVPATEKDKSSPERKTSQSSSKKPFRKRKSSTIKTGITTNEQVKPITKLGKAEKRRSKEKTSISKVKRKYIESAGISQSVKDLDKSLNGVEKASDVLFSSMRKPKPNYKVDVKTAPAWVARNVGEPSCSCANFNSKPKVTEKRKMNQNEIRRWCRDVEQGYKNLKTWNDWIENTTRTVCILRREIGGRDFIDVCPNQEWVKLKRNIDTDAALWKKMNHTTRERLKCYRKMYQKRSEVPNKYKVTCDCSQPKLSII